MKTHYLKIADDFFEIKDKLSYNKTLTKMLIAQKISAGMINRKITKKQLAEKVNQNPSVITKWLSGTHNFTIDTLVEIQEILKIKLI